jgi:hypothetical protein
VYRLRLLFPKREGDEPYVAEDGTVIEDLGEGPPYFVEGEFEGRLIVSVPDSASTRACQELQARLEQQFLRPALVLTHNIQFVEAVRLTAAEANAVVKQAEDGDAL